MGLMVGVAERELRYRFDRFTLIPARAALQTGEGGEITLRPKSFAVLQCLVERAGRLVAPGDLIEAVWPGLFVTDNSLAQCLKEVRAALGDEGKRIIRTLPRRGYMLSVAVQMLDSEAKAGGAAPEPVASAVLPPAFGRPTLLVLPFEAVQDEPYFARGLTADLVTDLTRFEDLRVVSPMRASETGNGAAIGADYVCRGTVQRSAGRIRINVGLQDVDSGVNLWAERIDSSLDDCLDAQLEISNRIAVLLDVQIAREQLRRSRLRQSTAYGAYNLFLQGRHKQEQATETGTLAARRLFDLAIAAAWNYAPAYAYQSFAIHRGFTLGWGEPRGRAALEPGLSLAEQAADLDPDSSLCLSRRAFALSLLSRDEEALEVGFAGVRANPCDTAARATYGETLSRAGMHASGAGSLNWQSR